MSGPIVVASHRRSGTHLLIDSLSSNLARYSTSSRSGFLNLDHASSHVTKWNLSAQEIEGCLERGCLVKTHAHARLRRFFGGPADLMQQIFEIVERGRCLYVYRDGRDVLTSLYHYHAGFDKGIREVSFSEYIRMPNDFDSSTYPGSMNRAAYWAFHVKSWIEEDSAFFISFEELRDRYSSTLESVAELLDEDLNDQLSDVRMSAGGPIGQIAQKAKSRLVNLISGREVHTSVSFRRGQSGGWRDVFSAEDSAFFQQEAGEINEALGYGSD